MGGQACEIPVGWQQGFKQKRSLMPTTDLSLEDIHRLARDVMMANGCDAANADALADIITRAERDGSHSHGLFRVPGYVKALRSGNVDGTAQPVVTRRSASVVHVAGGGCFAPLAKAVGLPVLAEAALESGAAALSLTGIHHFADLWPETEYLAERGLVGIACTAYMPAVRCRPAPGLMRRASPRPTPPRLPVVGSYCPLAAIRARPSR